MGAVVVFLIEDPFCGFTEAGNIGFEGVVGLTELLFVLVGFDSA